MGYDARRMRAAPTSLAILAAVALSGCGDNGDKPAEPHQRLRLWHTFNPTETHELNRTVLNRQTTRVESTLLPFGRAQTILVQALENKSDCPDLVRIDATWLPQLAGMNALRPPPAKVAGAQRWLPEALALASIDGQQLAIPQAIDGLALIHHKDTIRSAGLDWPPQTVDTLLADARRMTQGGNYGLAVRRDGYWFVAFLRAWGGDVVDPTTGKLNIDAGIAAEALEQFAALFGPKGVAPSPSRVEREAADHARGFRAGTIKVVLDGPWAVSALSNGSGSIDKLAVTPFPKGPNGRGAAPRGGQLLVVPTCAKRPDAAWQLALALVAPALQADWAKRYGLVPTTQRGLDGGGGFAKQFYRALKQARPLPRHPVSAELFDDLNPAITAVIAGDATAKEALAGVRRAWTRLLKRHGVQVPDGATP